MDRKEYLAEYHRKNRDEFKIARRKFYQRHKESQLKEAKQWRLDNPEKWRVLHTIHRKLARTRRTKAKGSFTKHHWAVLLEIYNWTCPMCLKKEPEIHLSIDHKIPLSKGGTNYPDNIQPLCLSCNHKKNDKIWFASCPLSLGS